METKSTCTKFELRGIRVLLQNRNNPLSIDSLHAYVHNQNYSPSPEELTRTWDNIEVFVRGLWKP